jgi:hypothetical protein
VTAHDAFIAERKRQRRIARRWETAVILLVLATALAVYFGYHPERADAGTYNHVSVCESTLRGYSSDDDVHNWGVATGAQSFGGWGAYGHYSDGSAYVWGAFNYSYGKVVWYLGRCTGGDYASDWFQG